MAHHRERQIVIAVASPENAGHSNGIRAFLEIALLAQQQGCEVAIFPSVAETASVCQLPEAYRSLSVIQSIPANACVIVGDSISDESLAYIRSLTPHLCHYSGAPYGLFTGVYANPYRGLQGERHAVFSPMVSIQFPYFYVQPALLELEQLIASKPIERSHTVPKLRSKTLKICVYSGKGHLKPLPHRLRRLIRRSRSCLITRLQPATKAELYQVIADSDAMICFDPMTSLSYEASLLGRPCLVISGWDEPSFLDRFPVAIDGIVFEDIDRFLALIKNGFDHAAVLADYRRAKLENHASVAALIAFALGEEARYTPTPPADIRSYWLSRQPFLQMLGLPSMDLPQLETALFPYHFSDQGRRFLRRSRQILGALHARLRKVR